MEASRRPIILHISGDFPDPIKPTKTPVVERIIELTRARFDHHVISINRRSPGIIRLARLGIVTGQRTFENGTAVQYTAPPKGLLHHTCLTALGDWVARHWTERNGSTTRPELIIGHKLSIEGIAASRAASLLGSPFAITLQGNTDLKILKARPDLRGRFAKIYHGAEMVFSLAPWTPRNVDRILGPRDRPTATLPCATDLDQILPPKTGGRGLVSLFHLANHKSKNLHKLAQAMQKLAREGDKTQLAIWGGGTPADFAACEHTIGGAANARLAGAPLRKDIPALLNNSIGFVMPSVAESFGLVFIEALFAGLPIIYPRGRAVDGYFDDMPFAIPVDPKSVGDISRAVMHLQRNEAELKAQLADWQTSDHARQFTRAAIAQKFADGLTAALPKRD